MTQGLRGCIQGIVFCRKALHLLLKKYYMNHIEDIVNVLIKYILI